MRRLAVLFVIVSSFALSSWCASIDRLNWSDAAAWNCVKVIAVRPFTVSGEFKGPKSQDEYMKYLVSRLAADLVRPGGIEEVTLVDQKDATKADAVLTGEFLELSTGSRAARFWVGFGAGTAKCDVRIRAYRNDERTPIFDLEHGRVSPFSMSGDANIGDIDAVTADISDELLRRHAACDPSRVVPAGSGPPRARTTPSPADGAKVNIGSSVENAEVFIDGRFVGNAPLPDFRLLAGLHTIEVRAQGYMPWKREISIEDGANTRVAAQLEKAQQ